MPRERLPVSTRAARAERKPGVKGRKGKYNASGRREDGHWFASTAEADRYLQLKRLHEAGKIDRLMLQPAFRITINNELICQYRADFGYDVLDERGRQVDHVVEDVKGMVTDVYALKKKMVQAQHRVKINEIPAKKVGQWEGRTP